MIHYSLRKRRMITGTVGITCAQGPEGFSQHTTPTRLLAKQKTWWVRILKIQCFQNIINFSGFFWGKTCVYFCKRVILVSNMWLFSFSLAFTSGLFVKALGESALSVYVCFHSNEEEPCLDGKLPSAIPGFGGSSLSPRQWHPVCCYAEGNVNRKCISLCFTHVR